MTVGILIISTQGFKLDIDVMLMRGHSSDCVHTRRAPATISREFSFNPPIMEALSFRGSGGQRRA